MGSESSATKPIAVQLNDLKVASVEILMSLGYWV